MAGLGNRKVTPDALGPYVVDNLNISRHIVKEYGRYAMGEDEVQMVSAVVPGVMGQTGMETVEIIRGIIGETKPDLLIVIDALAARSSRRLNRTIQISDAGIHPGSGVGNYRPCWWRWSQHHAHPPEPRSLPPAHVGEIPGSVTSRNLCHPLAPSNALASYSSFGTFSSADR